MGSTLFWIPNMCKHVLIVVINIIIIAGHAGDYTVVPLNAVYSIATQYIRVIGLPSPQQRF
jgi:hypothetical protein